VKRTAVIAGLLAVASIGAWASPANAKCSLVVTVSSSRAALPTAFGAHTIPVDAGTQQRALGRQVGLGAHGCVGVPLDKPDPGQGVW
jgi:hypothetical protein